MSEIKSTTTRTATPTAPSGAGAAPTVGASGTTTAASTDPGGPQTRPILTPTPCPACGNPGVYRDKALKQFMHDKTSLDLRCRIGLKQQETKPHRQGRRRVKVDEVAPTGIAEPSEAEDE